MQPTKDFDRYKWMKEPIINKGSDNIPTIVFQTPPKKLTFDEWCYTMPTTDWKNLCSHGYVVVAAAAWKAAQENE